MASKRQIVTGTVKQFVADGYKVNGQPVDQVALSTLCRLFGTPIGKVEQPGKKGKPATIWEMPVNLIGKMKVENGESTTAEA